MSGWERDIDALYLEYRPAAGHLEGCPLHGTGMWERRAAVAWVASNHGGEQ